MPLWIRSNSGKTVTAKFDNFKAALIALCEEHDVVLTYAPSFEELHVNDRHDKKFIVDAFSDTITKAEDMLWDATNKNQ